MFSPLYQRVINWSRHRHAPRLLGAMSFAESTFFPVPPDVMLIPMCLAAPQRAWRFALITTVCSVLGGLVGYGIGLLGLEAIEPLLERFGYMDTLAEGERLFAQYGFWFILLAGFTPIPYKIFTISAGLVAMPLPAFMLGSLVGRAGRFFLVAGLIRWGGEGMEQRIARHINILSWILLAVIVIGLILWKTH